MDISSQPVTIVREKLTSNTTSHSFTEAEILESARRAERKLAQERGSHKPAKFIEVE